MRGRGERGAAAVEVVLLVPPLLLLIAVVVGAGRIVSTKSALEAVAREAARVGSESPDPESSRSVTENRARRLGRELGLDSDRLGVEVEMDSFERGAPLEVRLTYRLHLDDLPGFGLIPGRWNVSAEHTELLDKHKSR